MRAATTSATMIAAAANNNNDILGLKLFLIAVRRKKRLTCAINTLSEVLKITRKTFQWVKIFFESLWIDDNITTDIPS